MNKTLKIAANELKSLFFSPIAWIVMIIFFYLTSSDYFDVTSMFIGAFERGGWGLKSCENLTSTLTANYPGAFLLRAVSNLFIFFPLITMGLISREISSGTIKLLYSSPVRIRQIVFGKFLAMVAFVLFLMLVILCIYANLAINITSPDYVQMFSSLFGVVLLFSTYAAIGLFVSSLTSYQIVAAVITVTVFAIFGKIGGMWQDISWVRGITFYLDFVGKSRSLIVGFFNLRDICYFLILIGAFLSFTILRLRSQVQFVSKGKKLLRTLAVIAVAFVIGYITSSPYVNVYWDSTRDKIFTITPHTQKTLAALNDGDLEITVVGNLFADFSKFTPAAQNGIIRQIWEPYTRFKPDIHVGFLYYYGADSVNNSLYEFHPGKTSRQIAEELCKTYKVNINQFLTVDQIKPIVDVAAEEYRCFFILKYHGRQTILRNFDDPGYWPGEDEISAAIKILTNDQQRVCFLNSEQERSPFLNRPRDYKSLTGQISNRYSLSNQGYRFDTLSLQNKEIPKGLAALAIADPRIAFTPESIEKINRYIDEGGNLFITGEPAKREVLQPLFNKLGISFKEGMLLQSNKTNSSNMVYGFITDAARNLSPQFARRISDDSIYEGVKAFRVALIGAAAINIKDAGFSVSPLLVTDPEICWNHPGLVTEDSLNLELKPQPGDETAPFVAAVKLERNINGKLQRIIVAADADFPTAMSMETTDQSVRRYNPDLAFWCFSQFSYGKFPANTIVPKSKDNSFKVTTEQFSRQKIYYYFLLPGLIVIAASVILIRRKRK